MANLDGQVLVFTQISYLKLKFEKIKNNFKHFVPQNYQLSFTIQRQQPN